MFFIYKILINLVFFFSPLIIIFRLFKGKEDQLRFKEKIGFFSKKRNKGNLIWFHGASVGEIQSIIPLVERFEKNKEIQQILITSNTVSSSIIIKNLKFKKTLHQFFPIDCNFVSKRFLNYWKPSKAFFIDSEIWPITINNLYKRNIPIFLLNGRITKKSFRRWKFFSYFAKSIFGKFYLCLSSNTETKKYLKKLGAKKVITLITNSAYADLIGDEIDIAISPQQVTISSLLMHVREGDISAVHSLRRGAAEAIELTAHGDSRSSKVVGRRLDELNLPSSVTVGAILRGNEVLIAHGDVVVEADDHVILFLTDRTQISAVEKLFAVGFGFI